MGKGRVPARFFWAFRLSAAVRLTIEESRRFAGLVRQAMVERRISSVYSLFLSADLPRSTLHRWLAGRGRIPVSRAFELLDALLSCGEGGAPARAIRDLLEAASTNESIEQRLRAELRARRVPISRTLDALRAANVLLQ